ncbi:hypothetical protein ACFLRC_01540 [Candidatus Altiarchaeota archaeon]
MDVKKVFTKGRLTDILILLTFSFYAIILLYPLPLDPTGLLGYTGLNLASQQSDAPRVIFMVDWYRENLQNGGDLLHNTKNYFPAGVHPGQDVFHPSHSLIAGLMSLFVPVVVAHNMLVFLALFTAGLNAYVLSKFLIKDKLSCLLCGFIYMSFPFTLYQAIIGHPNIMQMQWVPMVLLFTHRLLFKLRWCDLVLLAVFLNIQLLSSTQITVYLGLIIPLYVISLCINKVVRENLFSRKFYLMFAACIILFLTLSSPYIVGFLRTPTIFTRPLDINQLDVFVINELRELVDPSSYIALGFIPIILFLISLLSDVKNKSLKLMGPFYIMALSAFVLSLKPVFGFSSYAILYYFYPPIMLYREPQRIFVFALLSTAVASGHIFRRITFPLQTSKRIIILVALVFAVLITMVWQSPILVDHKVVHLENRPEIELFRFIGNLTEDFSVAEYPNNFCRICAYHTIFHNHSLIGGGSSFIPLEYTGFLEKCGGQSILNTSSTDCQENIRSYNLRYVVYDKDRFEDWQSMEPQINNLPHMEKIMEAGDSILYEISIS